MTVSKMNIIMVALGLPLAAYLEYSALHALFEVDSADTAVMAILVKHFASSAVIAWVTCRLLPHKYASSAFALCLMFFLLAFFIPALGALGDITLILAALHYPVRAAPTYIRQSGMPGLPFKPHNGRAEQKYGEGGIGAVFRNSRDPATRLQIVMTARHIKDEKLAISIYRKALKDRDDDVRLLAYSILSKKEKKIDRSIRNKLEAIRNSRETPTALRISLANDYWELAYLGLVQGEVLAHVLKEARSQLELALEAAPENPVICFMIGRNRLQTGKYGDAQKYFNKALGNGFPESDVAPYLAEVAFVNKKYADVARYMERIGVINRSQHPLSQVAGYWL